MRFMGAGMKIYSETGFHRWLLVGAVALFLTACGGGDSGTSVFGDGEDTSGTSAAADLSVSLSASTLSNSGSSTVTATVTAVDANRNAISGVPVSLKVDENAVVAVSGSTTSTTGTVTGIISPGADKSNRVITVTATSGSLKRTASLQVVGSKITSSLSLSVDANSTGNQVIYKLADVNGNALVGEAIAVSGAGVSPAQGLTDSNGQYIFSYTAPSTAGSFTLSGTGAGVTDSQIIQVVTGDTSVDAAVGPVRSAKLAANPDVVGVNTNTSSNQTELRALFLGADNAPIKNVRVRFDLAGDANTVGGSFTTGSTLLFSNANGVVTGAYRPGDRSSPTNGVTVRACWSLVDFANGVCPNEATTMVTVTQEPVAVTIGTNELIETGENDLTYIKKFVVMVVNASGQAMSDVLITPLIDLPAYYKGNYYRPDSDWIFETRTACSTEDLNSNGVLETEDLNGNGVLDSNEDVNSNGVLDRGEDVNGSGSLEPRRSDVSVRVVSSSSRTDAAGQVILAIEYPKNVASWVSYKLTVGANGVLGTEGAASFSGVLPVPLEAIKAEGTPAFVLSPYGVASICTNPN